MLVGLQYRYGVVRQRRVGGRPMLEVPTSTPSAESSFHIAHPQRAICTGVHGIHGIGRQRLRIVLLVHVVLQQQRFGQQSHDACRLRTYP